MAQWFRHIWWQPGRKTSPRAPIMRRRSTALQVRWTLLPPTVPYSLSLTLYIPYIYITFLVQRRNDFSRTCAQFLLVNMCELCLVPFSENLLLYIYISSFLLCSCALPVLGLHLVPSFWSQRRRQGEVDQRKMIRSKMGASRGPLIRVHRSVKVVLLNRRATTAR